MAVHHLALASGAGHYLTGQLTPGKRRQVGPDGFEPLVEYARQRLVDDPHLWASALHDELPELGYTGSYSSLPRRREDGTRCTVADLATAEGLRPVPTGPYPAIVSVEATVSPQGLVAFRGNRYSVGPGHGGAVVIVSHRLGTATLDLATVVYSLLARVESWSQTARPRPHRWPEANR